MLYQLASGYTIELSTEAYLDMSDAELKELECLSPSQLMEINNPWFKPFSSKANKQKAVDNPHAMYNVTDEEKMKEFYEHEKEDI